MTNMRIVIHPVTYIYLLTMAWLASWKICLGAMCVLIIHEAGHCLACAIAGERIERIEITPFGGIITYASGKSPSKGIRGIYTAAAGPAANGIFLYLSTCEPIMSVFDHELLSTIHASNLAMLCINLLPALPLDGGRVAFCLGYYVFPVMRLITLLSRLGILCGAMLLVIVLYGCLILGTLNCSLLIIGVYLIISAVRSRSQMLIENLYAVLQEKSEQSAHEVKKTVFYQIPPQINLLSLAAYLKQDRSCVFICHIKEKGVYCLTENQLSELLLDDPMKTMVEIHEKLRSTCKKAEGYGEFTCFYP